MWKVSKITITLMLLIFLSSCFFPSVKREKKKKVFHTPVKKDVTQYDDVSPEDIPPLSPAISKGSVPEHLPAVIKNPRDGALMILIPSGEFIMGSYKGLKNEKPPHKVYLDAYYIYKYEVTYAMFNRFVKSTGYESYSNWSLYNKPQYQDHPVMNTTYRDVVFYCKWAGVTLPTEAQWEKAARGVDGRMYPWGNQWDPNKCNNSQMKDPSLIKKMANMYNGRGTLPVGSVLYDCSPYGVMDMAGNVREWCFDWYSPTYYKVSPYKNPVGPSKGSERVVRGGSWSLPPKWCRTSARWSGSLNSIMDNYGFRCAASIDFIKNISPSEK